MEVSAKMKGAQVAAQKARLVANQIRGKSVEEALLLLEYSPKKGAMLIKKVLNSAIQSAPAFAFSRAMAWSLMISPRTVSVISL